MYTLFSIKRYIEQIIMFPFVVLGKIFANLNPLKEEYDVFLFFPGFAIGGAERVNAEIVKALADKKVIIFFTKNSPNDGMKHFFQLPHVTIKEINKWTDNKWKYWNNLIYRGICSTYINKQNRKPSVFIGQCNFAYKLTPHINRSIKITELIHMYDPKFTWVWAPFIQFINQRIIVGKVFQKKFALCYQNAGIPSKYLSRLKIIFYKLEYLPTLFHQRTFELPLKVYYAGRGGPQKRVWIIVKIIQACRAKNLPIEFKLAGPFKEELPLELIEDKTYVGELKGGEEMYALHKNNDVLLMTSAWEGFPLVIMEAMAFGAIPLVSNIDAIPEHIQHGKNGFLLNHVDNENKLVDEAVVNLIKLIDAKSTLKNISQNAYDYAINNFSEEKFINSYRESILN
ncbi:MAG: glycosyltransferase family 4 protein [Chitinophagaceae bacterium]|nr:glycosyltransferase family 4 protein [Chitinophagaceae bacterium]HMN32686.1 glycosyltransferase family 4 protein [Chitinophagaceae bacterium]